MPTSDSTLQVPQVTRPVIFSGEMVGAILDGRKTQTRRIVKIKPEDAPYTFIEGGELRRKARYGSFLVPCRYGVAGDRLWVRETHCIIDDPAGHDPADGPYPKGEAYQPEIIKKRGPKGERWVVDYRADEPHTRIMDKIGTRRWRPSIHMPRWASRITLEITKVRVERLQDISEEDAEAEGAPKCALPELHENKIWFLTTWDSLHGKGSWEKNPWVWVLEFKRHLSEQGTKSATASGIPKSVSLSSPKDTGESKESGDQS